MGYVTKEELMESLKSEGGFNQEELDFIDHAIGVCQNVYDGEAILSLINLNDFEDKGLLKRFQKVCAAHRYFPEWLDNWEKGADGNGK